MEDNGEEESSNRRRSYKKSRYIDRDREAANTRLMNDYFVDRPLYPEYVFRRRFRMRKHIFLRVVEAVTAKQHEYFQQRPDATGKLGATPIQKCTAALRMLAYGFVADSVDEYIKIA
ncbi:uncharacterized protein [Spinacia oleracea]|uniref:Uncharacterized protein n=1 Tax=Spinacia oleracea TaxID=3562 RepID=A0ABM3QQ08_SPIOL|nr:uncharacterized protein LOC110791456 [Spinacia oleracea]